MEQFMDCKFSQRLVMPLSGLQGRGGPGVASDGSKGENSLDAVTPGATLGTLYSSGVDSNKTKQHNTHVYVYGHAYPHTHTHTHTPHELGTVGRFYVCKGLFYVCIGHF